MAALLDAQRAREPPERFLLLERFLEAERARERDLDLLDERRLLALRDLPLDDFPLLLAERHRLYTNADTSRVYMRCKYAALIISTQMAEHIYMRSQ